MDKTRLFVQAIGKYLPGVLMVVALLTPSFGFSQIVHESETDIEGNETTLQTNLWL